MTTQPPRPTTDPAVLASAYRDARTGARPAVKAGPYIFCATREGLEVALNDASYAADYTDKSRDNSIQDAAVDAIRRDPRLRGQDVHVKTWRGEILLSGHVDSDALAVRAVEDVVSIVGAVDVNVELMSPESPGPAARTANRLDTDCPW